MAITIFVCFVIFTVYCALTHQMDLYATFITGLFIGAVGVWIISEFFELICFIAAIVCVFALFDEEEKKEDTK
ncbi:hypothetical protein DLC15_23725 [Salmonella enterica subsp. enterica serovar Telelkebir]|nr:hypothetical protein [Salmonella enterica subsp. enterica serovar Telelkebir]